MALIFFDGFDHYDIANQTGTRDKMAGAWNYDGSTGPTTYFTLKAMPELGSFAACVNNLAGGLSSGDARLRKNIDTKSAGTFGVGFYAYFDGGAGFMHSSNCRLVSLQEGNTVRSSIAIPQDGLIRLYVGTDLIATHDTALSSNTVYHFEFQYHFGNGDGYLELRLDGETIFRVDDLTLTGAINRVALFTGTSGSIVDPNDIFVDNFYIYDNTGSVNNDWLGERRVYTLRPDSDGTPQNWTLSSGTNAFELLNNTPSNPNTDFISTGTINDEAAFGLSDLPSPDIVVNGVQAMVEHYKTGTDPSSISITLNTESPFINSITDDARWGVHIEELNSSSEPFVPAEVNGMGITVKRTS